METLKNLTIRFIFEEAFFNFYDDTSIVNGRIQIFAAFYLCLVLFPMGRSKTILLSYYFGMIFLTRSYNIIENHDINKACFNSKTNSRMRKPFEDNVRIIELVVVVVSIGVLYYKCLSTFNRHH